MKWYFCLDEHGSTREIGAWALLAVQSARRNTDFDPVCLFDGNPDCAFVKALEPYEVEVRVTRSRLASAIEDAHARIGYPIHAKGAFLRAEVPDMEQGSEYALYTDCDVVFLSQPRFGSLRPAVLAAGPRQNLYDTDQFNSGVLYFNVEGFRRVQDRFFEFAASHLGPFLPGVDEPILNRFFADSFDILPTGLNWRPFFGFNPTAPVVHFHGPKMLQLVQFVTTGPTIEWGFYAHTLSRLIASSLPNYARYLDRITDDFTLPPQLEYQVGRFLRAYPRFRSELAERYGEARLDSMQKSADFGQLTTQKNRLLNALVARLPDDALNRVEYVFEGPPTRFPNLLVRLFPRSGMGVLSRITYLSEGSAERRECPLERTVMRHGESVALGEREGRRLIAEGDGIELLLNAEAIPERGRVRAITLECIEYVEDEASAIFADSKAGFYAVNTVQARRVAAAS